MKNKEIVKILKIQGFLSIIGIFISLIIFFINNKNNSQDNYSKEILLANKLSNIYQTENLSTETTTNIFCSIEIPKIGIIYPVFKNFTEELLLLSPCKFNGPNLGEYGNISIVGHNFDNNSFFSNLNILENNDIIYLNSNSGQTYEYKVYKTYETDSNDLSPISTNFINKKELTLITCNNQNKKRFIVKALSQD